MTQRLHDDLPNAHLLMWVLWKTCGAAPFTITPADEQACRQAFQPGGPRLLRRDVGTGIEVRVTSRDDARIQMEYASIMDRVMQVQGTCAATEPPGGPAMARLIEDPKVRALALCLDVMVRMDPATVAAHALAQSTDDEFDAAVQEAAGFLWGPRRDDWPADVKTVLARR